MIMYPRVPAMTISSQIEIEMKMCRVLSINGSFQHEIHATFGDFVESSFGYRNKLG
jgi:hypothetical protein